MLTHCSSITISTPLLKLMRRFSKSILVSSQLQLWLLNSSCAHSESPRAQYGLAQCFDLRAQAAQSNQLLEMAIEQYAKGVSMQLLTFKRRQTYISVLENRDTPLELFDIVAEKIIERSRFRGWFQKALKVRKRDICEHFRSHFP